MEKNLKMALAKNDEPCTIIVKGVAYKVVVDTFSDDCNGRFHVICREVGRTSYNQFYVSSNWKRSLPPAYIEYIENRSTQYIDTGLMLTPYTFQIEKVIFNPPATIVFWKDGTKSVVKCREDDIFDPEKGLTMAIAKKVYGNKYDYYNVIKKWLKKYEANIPDFTLGIADIEKGMVEFSNAVLKHFGGKEKSNEDI